MCESLWFDPFVCDQKPVNIIHKDVYDFCELCLFTDPVNILLCYQVHVHRYDVKSVASIYHVL